MLAKSDCLYGNLLILNTQHVQRRRTQPRRTAGSTQSRSSERERVRDNDAQSPWHTPPASRGPTPPSCFASFEICCFRPCVACEDSTAEDQLVPAGADANQPLPLLSKSFLFVTAWPSRGYRFAALSSSRCVLSLLPEFLVAPPKSPSSSSFLLLFCAPPPGSLNCL